MAPKNASKSTKPTTKYAPRTSPKSRENRRPILTRWHGNPDLHDLVLVAIAQSHIDLSHIGKLFPDHVTVNGIEQFIGKERKRMLRETGLHKNDPNLIAELYQFYRYKNKPRKATGGRTTKKQQDSNETEDDDDDEQSENEESYDTVASNKPELKLVIDTDSGTAHVKSVPSHTTKIKSRSSASTSSNRINKNTVDTSSTEPRLRPRRSATKGVKYTTDATSSDDDTSSASRQGFFAREHSPAQDSQLIKSEHIDDSQQASFGAVDTLPASTSADHPASSFEYLPSFYHSREPAQTSMADYPMTTTEGAPVFPQFDHNSLMMMAPEPIPQWGYGYTSSPDTPQTAFETTSSQNLGGHYDDSFQGLGIDMSGMSNHYDTYSMGFDASMNPDYMSMAVPLEAWYN